jgi:hypothetical protein
VKEEWQNRLTFGEVSFPTSALYFRLPGPFTAQLPPGYLQKRPPGLRRSASKIPTPRRSFLDKSQHN